MSRKLCADEYDQFRNDWFSIQPDSNFCHTKKSTGRVSRIEHQLLVMNAFYNSTILYLIDNLYCLSQR